MQYAVYFRYHRISKGYYGVSFDEATGALTGQAGKTYTDALDPANDHYINPYGSFKGKVVRDINNVIVGIIFEQ